MLLRSLASIGLMLHFAGAIFVAAAQAQDITYTAAFADGTYVADAKLAGWHDATATPQLNGKNVFDAAAPLLWMASNAKQTAVQPEAFVEFVGGDCLPGMVQGYRNGVESWTERLPPHLLVKPRVSIDLPGKPERGPIGVRTDLVRRVVWQRGGVDRYQPGTLVYLDGRAIAFRSLRWTNQGVLVLLADGTRRASFSELAELHLPRRDEWDAYLQTAATLTPDGESPLLRLSTVHGLVATTSQARLHAMALSHDERSWYHLVQPAWSLAAMWVQHATVAHRQIWQADKVPLSLIAPQAARRTATYSGGWSWQADRNVRGETLRSARRQFGWGISMPSRTELAFALPKLARGFRAQVGLDEAVGQGGCATAQLFANAASGNPMWQSDLLIGSDIIRDTGVVQLLGPDKGQKSLVLVADAAHDNRPAGADPFDIRDMVDWLEPVIELDSNELKQELARRQREAIFAWADWQLALAPGARLQVVQRLAEPQDKHVNGYHREVIASEGPITLKRTWTVDAAKPLLAVGVYRPNRDPGASRIEIRVNDLPYVDFEVPKLDPQQAELPRMIDLTQFVGREVQVEVVHVPADEQGRAEWRTLEPAAGTTVTPWVPLQLVNLQSQHGTTLEEIYDGSVWASGTLPEEETYTITGTAPLKGVSAIRVDLIPDGRLPGRGAGRDSGGAVTISHVELAVTSAEQGATAMPISLGEALATFEHDQHHRSANLIDQDTASRWTTWPQHTQPQSFLVKPQYDLHLPQGAVLQLSLKFNQSQRSAGRLRVWVTDAPPPVLLEPHAPVLSAKYAGKARVLFEDDEAWQVDMHGSAMDPVSDRYSGKFAWRVKPDKRARDRLPGVEIPIRENPGPGEARFLRWAWKKQGGEMIVLEIAHDGLWGQAGESKFRYQAGPGPEYHNQALKLDQNLPSDWTVVTRDLFADFGEFIFTGLAMTPLDGEYGYFDHILLAPTVADLDAAESVTGTVPVP
jgi:hypothetical protein